MMVPKTVYQAVGTYDMSLSGLEDWDWIIRAVSKGYIGLSVSAPLHYARVHQQRVTTTVLSENIVTQLYASYPDMERTVKTDRVKARIRLWIRHPKRTFSKILGKIK
jgi:hypothetical protein